MRGSRGPSVGGAIAVLAAVAAGLTFTYAAVQGDHGLFRQVRVEARTQELREELAVLRAEVVRHENLTRRLSDDFLDVDLLDERVRAVLGYAGEGEVVLR